MSTIDPLAAPGPLLDRIYAYVAYRIGPGPAAEDVTSDVLERALRYRRSYDPARGSPEAWAIGIARRCLAEPRRESLPLPEEAAGAEGFEQEVHGRLVVRAAVRELPERSRELVALRYGADLGDAQIAVLLDMTPGAVRVALHRALARLREVLERPMSESSGRV